MSVTSASPGSCAFFRTATADDVDKVSVDPDFIHPELSATGPYGIKHIQDKPPLGVAFSGGGFRAATCAAGYARGLHMIKLDDGKSVMSKVRYLASTSGGSWFNAAFSYKAPDRPMPSVDKFLDGYMEAEKLTLKKLAEMPAANTFEEAIAKHNTLDRLLARQRTYWLPSAVLDSLDNVDDFTDNITDYVKKLWNGPSTKPDADDHHHDQNRRVPEWVRPWTLAVSKTFLEPFQLGVYEDATLSAAGTNGNIDTTRAAKNAKTVLLACSDPDRPFPIMTGTCFNPPGDDGYSMYPVEFSPLYFGTPCPFPNCSPAFGGGYMEPWGLHAQPGLLVCGPDGCTGSVTVSRNSKLLPLHTVPLAQAASISSSFLAVATWQKPQFAQDLASTERLMNWGVLPSATSRVPDQGLMGFADGGALDNLAVMPLLRRGVRSMIVFMAGATPPDDTWETFADEKNDVAALFGAAKTCSTPGITAGMLNDISHVFGESHYEGEKLFRELFEGLHRKLRAGEPGFFRGSYMVQENKFFHIPASSEPVEVLWISNQQWADWEKSLPPETHAQLQKDRKGKKGNNPGVHHKSVMLRENFQGEIDDSLRGGFLTQDDFYRFPYFTTYSLDYGNEAVHLLGQMSTAVLLHKDVQTHIKDLVDKAVKAQARVPKIAAAV